ncbi:unnamed protein product [Prorocentrum cordatum]|uniref:SAM domain-containing protein n=1 Tax=Prorocentrum cordatum TaxID=2364126 RepID=A0ABN9URG9_9DINO|nr:unnamed protein product [Polarella glacialis]
MPTHRYEGEWEEDSQHGIGVEETEEFIYCGNFANGQRSGRGISMPHWDSGVKGCRVLSEGSWRPLVDFLQEREERHRVPASSSSSTFCREGAARDGLMPEFQTPTPTTVLERKDSEQKQTPKTTGPAAVDPREALGVSSPSLWSEVELAAIVHCLGVNPEAAKMVRGRRLHGVKGLLELSNSTMARQLGLVSPLERLVVRRALQRLHEAEIHENSERGRRCCDLMAAPGLSAHAIEVERLTILSRIAEGGFGAVHRPRGVDLGASWGRGSPALVP